MTVGFVYDSLFLEHDTGSHPENPQRMLATMELLESCGLLAKLIPVPTRDATRAELALVHDGRYIDAVQRVATEGGGWADPDTLITPRSYAVAARAVGATLAALDAVLGRQVESAFCLVRPPGHHATTNQAMGFCLFNHVAVAAAYARQKRRLERVAIVDFDVHHGNGTQDVFYRDPSVLYVSTHEYPFYPGTGAAEEVGEADGRGYNINIPMPHGAGDLEHRRAFEEIVLPVLRSFAPHLILVSAGYDAHHADDIAYQRVSVDGFGALVSLIRDAARDLCDGKVLFALEGGYHLTALPWSVRRTLELLRGDEPTPDPLGAPRAAPLDEREFSRLMRKIRSLHRLS